MAAASVHSAAAGQRRLVFVVVSFTDHLVAPGHGRQACRLGNLAWWSATSELRDVLADLGIRAHPRLQGQP
jgi:hypothetical protein